MPIDKNAALADIDRVLKHQPATGNVVADFRERRTMMHACVLRWAPSNSAYVAAAKRTAQLDGHPDSDPIGEYSATLRALRADIDADQLRTFVERVRADLFTDLMAQGEYLNGEGYRRAAAVLAGGVLEEHLRLLATRHRIALRNAKGDSVKASFLNDQLMSTASAYGKSDHSFVSGWLKMRNDAAHGVAGFETTYDENDVRRMMEGIQAFIAKYPA